MVDRIRGRLAVVVCLAVVVWFAPALADGFVSSCYGNNQWQVKNLDNNQEATIYPNHFSISMDGLVYPVLGPGVCRYTVNIGSAATTGGSGEPQWFFMCVSPMNIGGAMRARSAVAAGSSYTMTSEDVYSGAVVTLHFEKQADSGGAWTEFQTRDLEPTAAYWPSGDSVSDMPSVSDFNRFLMFSVDSGTVGTHDRWRVWFDAPSAGAFGVKADCYYGMTVSNGNLVTHDPPLGDFDSDQLYPGASDPYPAPWSVPTPRHICSPGDVLSYSWGDWIGAGAPDGKHARSWIYGPLYRRKWLGDTAVDFFIANTSNQYFPGKLIHRARLAGVVEDAANTWRFYIEFQACETAVTPDLPTNRQEFGCTSDARFDGVYVVAVGRNGFMSVDWGTPPGGLASGYNGSESFQQPFVGYPSQLPVTAHIYSILQTPENQLGRFVGASSSAAPRWEFVGDEQELRDTLQKIADNFTTKQDFKVTIPRSADALFDNDGGSGGGTPYDPTTTYPTPYAYYEDVNLVWPNRDYDKTQTRWTKYSRWLPETIGATEWPFYFNMPSPLGGQELRITSLSNGAVKLNGTQVDVPWASYVSSVKLIMRAIMSALMVLYYLTNLVALIFGSSQ